jgi:hypothetical protein
MTLQEIVDYLPPKQDLMRFARYVSSLRRPSRSELVLCGIGGALVGAGLALLFTPARGAELRGAIGARIEEYWNELEALRARSNGDAAREH